MSINNAGAQLDGGESGIFETEIRFGPECAVYIDSQTGSDQLLGVNLDGDIRFTTLDPIDNTFISNDTGTESIYCRSNDLFVTGTMNIRNGEPFVVDGDVGVAGEFLQVAASGKMYWGPNSGDPNKIISPNLLTYVEVLDNGHINLVGTPYFFGRTPWTLNGIIGTAHDVISVDASGSLVWRNMPTTSGTNWQPIGGSNINVTLDPVLEEATISLDASPSISNLTVAALIDTDTLDSNIITTQTITTATGNVNLLNLETGITGTLPRMFINSLAGTATSNVVTADASGFVSWAALPVITPVLASVSTLNFTTTSPPAGFYSVARWLAGSSYNVMMGPALMASGNAALYLPDAPSLNFSGGLRFRGGDVFNFAGGSYLDIGVANSSATRMSGSLLITVMSTQALGAEQTMRIPFVGYRSLKFGSAVSATNAFFPCSDLEVDVTYVSVNIIDINVRVYCYTALAGANQYIAGGAISFTGLP